jgi:hypothetical protein
MSQSLVYDNPEVRFAYYGLIPHPTERQVLVLSNKAGWMLPHFAPQEHHFGVVDHVNQAMLEQLGIKVTTLCCIYNVPKRSVHSVIRAYAMDNHSPDWIPPPDAVWLKREALDTVEWAEATQGAIVEEWFDWLDEPSPLRVPWARFGWFEEAARWIDKQLKRLDLMATGPVEQIRAWTRGCVLRVATTAGVLYFKAVPRAFTHEPVLTRVLSQRHPQHTPKVLAVDVERGWMLMRDMGGTPLNQYQAIDQWEAALHTFGRVQVDMVTRTASLIGIGCPDRHVDELMWQIDRLVADKAALIGGLADLSSTEFEAFAAFAPTLKRLGYDLMAYDIPLSLEHGDLWSGNIRVTEDQHVYFDWSNSSVSHPFFDLVLFLGDIEDELPQVPDARTRLRDAYLAAWTAYEPMERLVQAFELAQPLAALHYALVYHQVIMPSLEPRAHWELADMLPYYVRRVLKQIQHSAGSAKNF